MNELELLDAGFVTAPLEAILEYWDPTLDDPWGCGKIKREDVLTQVNDQNFISSSAVFGSDEFFSYDFNTARIAYLIHHGWPTAADDDSPITLDVGFSGFSPPELVVDGNHRLAAAKFRGDLKLQFSVIGDVEKAVKVFCNGVHMDDY